MKWILASSLELFRAVSRPSGLADVAIEEDMLHLRLRGVDEQHLARRAVAVVRVPKPREGKSSKRLGEAPSS